MILRQRFLREIGQYLPDEGRVLDVGCGFGLFSNYFAQLHPDCYFEGFDINARRIGIACNVARRLAIPNGRFFQADLLEHRFETRYRAAYLIDILHHVPRREARRVLWQISGMLPLGGRLVVKDVLRRPWHKALFTKILDRLIVGWGYVRYWEIDEMESLLEGLGFEVHHHEMVDRLPYSHVLFAARKINEPDPVFVQTHIEAPAAPASARDGDGQDRYPGGKGTNRSNEPSSAK